MLLLVDVVGVGVGGGGVGVLVVFVVADTAIDVVGGGELQECLGTKSTVQLDSPATQLLAVGTQGEIQSTLNVTAGEEGGTVVWQVEEVIMPFTEEVSQTSVL